jgi:hypothetical protein
MQFADLIIRKWDPLRRALQRASLNHSVTIGPDGASIDGGPSVACLCIGDYDNGVWHWPPHVRAHQLGHLKRYEFPPALEALFSADVVVMPPEYEPLIPCLLFAINRKFHVIELWGFYFLIERWLPDHESPTLFRETMIELGA